MYIIYTRMYIYYPNRIIQFYKDYINDMLFIVCKNDFVIIWIEFIFIFIERDINI